MSSLPPSIPQHPANPHRLTLVGDKRGASPGTGRPGFRHGRVSGETGSKPSLRLVGYRPIDEPDSPPPAGQDITGTDDPRWVLAVRVSEQLEGTLLPPAKRDRLVQLGKMFGLTAFDANLVIAIVQDQARRGYAPAYCATAGEAQLRMIPVPKAGGWCSRPRAFLLAGLVSGFIALELIALTMIL